MLCEMAMAWTSCRGGSLLRICRDGKGAESPPWGPGAGSGQRAPGRYAAPVGSGPQLESRVLKPVTVMGAPAARGTFVGTSQPPWGLAGYLKRCSVTLAATTWKHPPGYAGLQDRCNVSRADRRVFPTLCCPRFFQPTTNPTKTSGIFQQVSGSHSDSTLPLFVPQ